MDPRVLKLKLRDTIVQRTKEWYEKRKSMITASSAASLVVRDEKTCRNYINLYNLADTFDLNGRSCNPYSSKNQFILDKCVGSTFKGSTATFHGNKYEDVVIDIYRNKNKTEVIDFGVLGHEQYSFLGASPDGITPDGIMLEIKCPYGREITGIPPLYYYIQVQLQLEVCDLEECDFLEYKFIECLSKEEFLDDTTYNKPSLHKGAVIGIQKIVNGEIDHSQTEHIYPPRNILDNDEKIIEWYESSYKKYSTSIKDEFKDKIKITGNYWKVTDYCNTRIKRDREWFANVLPTFEQCWKEIEFYRLNDNYRMLTRKPKGDLSGSSLRIDLADLAHLTDDEK